MRPAGPLLCPILVGRDELLDLADRRLDEAAAGHGQLILLAGEAGIGKTRVLGAIIRKAAAEGFRIAKGELAPQDRQVPLASILDLARTMRRTPGFGDLSEELLRLQVRRGANALGSRRALVLDIAECIVGAIDRPTVLAFEDLQWADELSLEVIHEVARAGRSAPLLLIGAYRVDELPIGSIHREWRSRLLSQRLAEEARLAPLTRDQTALVTTFILATGLPAPREVVNAVYERSDGIPLHIEELLGALGEEARHDGRAIREAMVPDTIEDAILARFGGLSDDARAVARAGAVLGRCFVPEVLAGIMDRPVAELDDPLDELVSASFLHTFGGVDPGNYDFRHQLLRDALYRSVPAAELRRLHARAAEFGAHLEGASEIHASLHFERAGLRPQAYRAALGGARAASAVSSRREAFELYARAARNVTDGVSAGELGELYHGFSQAAFAIDDVAVAEETTRLARRYFLEAGRTVEAARALASLANMARRDVRPMGERHVLLAAAEAELEALPATPTRSGALSDVSTLQAMCAIGTGRLKEADALLDVARRLRLESDDRDTGEIDLLAAEVDVLAGRVGPGLQAMLAVARRARDANLEDTGVTAYREAAVMAVRVMDYPTAEVGLREGLRYADEIEQSYCRHVMAAAEAHVAWAAGRWDDAIPIAGIEIVEPGSRRGTLGSRDALAYVAFGRGDVERAENLLTDSLAIGRASGEVDLILFPLWGLAETALVAGEPVAASEHCEAALELAIERDERALLVPFVVTGVRAYIAARRPADAERWRAAATDQLVGWEQLTRPALDHADGLLRLAAGSTVSARESLEAAVRGWDSRGRTWESLWARLDLARCLARSGRYADATVLLSDIRATAARLGSTPLLERVDELARHMRGRATDDEPWHPLTSREFEVGRLIAAGMTNAEIAAELGIAPKTASAHVEHILSKLGLARRTEVAAWASAVASAGRTPPRSVDPASGRSVSVSS